MGNFLEAEKRRQARLKNTTTLFSEPARNDGQYRGKPRPFCLPEECAPENLFPGVREQAVDYFRRAKIKWHDGKDGNPSNHLCDSQVCCVNFLFPFATHPEALSALLRPWFPGITTVLPMEADGRFVSFEWIGKENYLGERMPRGGTRTRGAHYTSADAAVMFERADGRRHIVLIEWKYTESYAVAKGEPPLKVSRSGTDRTAIYRPLFDESDCPIRKDLLPSFDALFVEPFYQFMRQQFLAREMERANELDADVVSVLHICPAKNTDFAAVTSPALRNLGDSAVKVWKALVREQDRFLSCTTEEMFGCPAVRQMPETAFWFDWVQTRYPWVVADRGACPATAPA